MKNWILILLTATALSAQQEIPWGQEFRINSYTELDQQNTSVAGLSDGGFVACWESNVQDGDRYGIYAQRYGAGGKAQGVEFRVNSSIDGFQTDSFVANLSSGGFVVCWRSWSAMGSSDKIYGQRYGIKGEQAGGEFRIGGYTKYTPYLSSIASLSGGGFVVCWESWNQDISNHGIYAQRYSASGDPLDGEFRVNSHVESWQSEGHVTGLSNGGFVACWESIGQDGSLEGIYAQRYGADGAPIGGEFRINSYTEGRQMLPSGAGLSDGGFMVCWSSLDQDGSVYGVYAQRYGADGKPEGGEFRINSYTEGWQCRSSVAALSEGGFVVCWESGKWDGTGQDGSGYGIYAQRYAADGRPDGGEFRVNSYTNKDQWHPKAAGLSDGGFVVCWVSWEQDGDGWGVYGKRFPAELLRHQLRPFALLQPAYDATVIDGKPQVVWQAASDLTIAYPWELEYTVHFDTMEDFSTASFKEAGPDTTVKLPALQLGKTYFWKVLAKTYYGDSLWSEVGAFFVSHTATGVEAEAVPGQFTVLSNYPNPFNPSTTLRFELPQDGCVTLKIYDLSGRLVKTLLSGEQAAGANTAMWDGADDAGRRVAAGVYFYQLEFTDASGTRQVLTQKMSLVK